jgi:ATP-binding cassette subfamily B multidrug efflux pump
MKSLSYLNKYFYKYRYRLLLGVLFIIIQNYFLAKMPVLIGETSDYLTGKRGENLNIDQLFWIGISLAGFYVLFNLIKGFFLFLTRQTIIIMSRLIEYDLKNEIFTKYQELDYKFYKSKTTGDLMNRIAEDVSQVRQYLGPGIMYTVNLVILLPFITYQMFAIDVQLALLTLIPLPVMAILIYFVSNKMNLLSKNVQVEQSNLSTIGQETFAGIRVIKAYLQEKHTLNKFNTSADNYHSKNMRLVKANALFMPTISLLIGLSTLLSIYIGGVFALDTDLALQNGTVPAHQVSPGNIITLVLCVSQLTWPFASVGWVTSIIQRAAASQTRINEFLTTKPEIINKSSTPFTSFQSLVFDNVSFQYTETGRSVLSNINFTINKGTTLGIVGKTGAGKSTLLQLIVRQLDPTSGVVLYNNDPMQHADLSQFRDQLAVVPQDVFLFSDTIHNNIAFGSKNQENLDERIHEAAAQAHVLHNIEEFPNKFETVLGERGVNLSGGQKQRVSIARALIRQPKLLLLDDCLSAVDTETEEIILRNLKAAAEKHETTTVIVSHRISSLRNADFILVLDNGVITEKGTHESLLDLKGNYFEMYEKQLLEEPKTIED